jgi:hypothetical protein
MKTVHLIHGSNMDNSLGNSTSCIHHYEQILIIYLQYAMDCNPFLISIEPKKFDVISDTNAMLSFNIVLSCFTITKFSLFFLILYLPELDTSFSNFSSNSSSESSSSLSLAQSLPGNFFVASSWLLSLSEHFFLFEPFCCIG